jgi:hypothetical protein
VAEKTSAKPASKPKAEVLKRIEDPLRDCRRSPTVAAMSGNLGRRA